MSCYKIKNISLQPKNNKIIVCAASSNCTPITYYTENIIKDNENYHQEELSIMKAINGGGWVLNKSCYNWNYAKMKTNEEIYGNINSWQIYDNTLAGCKLYYKGKIPWNLKDSDIKLTDEEIATGDYVIKWQASDDSGFIYYNKNEYKLENERINAILENYYNVFMKYFNEKIEGKYCLYSEKYGYIKPKGTSGYFYHNPNAYETIAYKKAYCISQYVGGCFEVKKV